MKKLILSITIIVQILIVQAIDEPLGRNYRKNFNNQPVNSHTNNGKILSTSETKISSVSFKPDSNGKFSNLDNTNLKTSASEKEEEKFSIGLGVLSPSYSQSFGDGKTKLDFNSDKGGFSYSLTNVVHPQSNSPSSQSSSAAAASSPSSSAIATNTLNKVQSAGFVPSSYYNNPTPQTQSNPQVNIYHKQTADPSQAIYGRLPSNANNYPLPPSAAPSPYSPNPLANLPSPQNTAAAPTGSYGYNPYNAAIGPQPFNTALSDAEKSFLQTVPTGPYNTPIGTHQHSLPQALPAAAAASSSIQQPTTTQSLTQPKLVAQQQLTANLNPGNILHNAQYGPYSNPYSNPTAQQINPYGPAGPSANPYDALSNPLSNPYAAGAYPSGLNMAASQQYPTQQQFNPLAEQMGAGLNYDFLNEFLY